MDKNVTMKYFLIVLLILVVVGAGVGLYIRSSDIVMGDLIIGVSVATAFFLLMPLFIYYRWKDRNVKDYMLTKENIDKMRKHGEDKKL